MCLNYKDQELSHQNATKKMEKKENKNSNASSMRGKESK